MTVCSKCIDVRLRWQEAVVRCKKRPAPTRAESACMPQPCLRLTDSWTSGTREHKCASFNPIAILKYDWHLGTFDDVERCPGGVESTFLRKALAAVIFTSIRSRQRVSGTTSSQQNYNRQDRKRKEEQPIPISETRIQRTYPSTLSRTRSKHGSETSIVKEEILRFQDKRAPAMTARHAAMACLMLCVQAMSVEFWRTLSGERSVRLCSG